MPKISSHKFKRAFRRSQRHRAVPYSRIPKNLGMYRGTTSNAGQQPIVVRLCSGVQLQTTSVSGNADFKVVFSAQDVKSGLGDFNDYAGAYQDFRVLKIRADFIPAYQNSSISPSPATDFVTRATPLFIAPFHEDSTALIGDTGAYLHSGSTAKSINQRHDHEVSAASTTDIDWTSTSLPASQYFGLKTYFFCTTSGATTVANHGHIYVTYVVEFRTRALTNTQNNESSSLPLPPSKSDEDAKLRKDQKSENDIKTKQTTENKEIKSKAHTSPQISIPPNVVTPSTAKFFIRCSEDDYVFTSVPHVSSVDDMALSKSLKSNK